MDSGFDETPLPAGRPGAVAAVEPDRDVLRCQCHVHHAQPGGRSVAGDEPVGRHILIPNALLFSEVMINYTADQNAAYMLDEVFVRITYDSDWKAAEEILLQAASAVTHDVIAATNRSPYIRADLYDYGVYMRLRYLTRVQERARTSYRILKRVFAAIQASPVVDVAIPYVYSFRAAADRKENGAERSPAAHEIHEIDVEAIRGEPAPKDEKAVAELAEAIGREGLLQPIVVCEGVSQDRTKSLPEISDTGLAGGLGGGKSLPCLDRPRRGLRACRAAAPCRRTMRPPPPRPDRQEKPAASLARQDAPGPTTKDSQQTLVSRRPVIAARPPKQTTTLPELERWTTAHFHFHHRSFTTRPWSATRRPRRALH